MYMLRSIIKGSLLTGAALLLAASAQAQCKAFAKNKCVPELAPYKFNENFNAAQLSPGDEAEVDIAKNTITRLSDGKIFALKPVGAVAPVIAAGGMFAYAREIGMIKK